MNLGRIAKGTKGVKRASKAAKATKRAAKAIKSAEKASKAGRKVIDGARVLKKTAETESVLAKSGEALKRSKRASKKFRRSMSERRKALLRDANDPKSGLSQEARDFIKDNNGYKVPKGHEVSHEVPLYTEKTVEGKKKLDVAKNMKTMDKKNHRDRHKACGDQFHDFPR